MREEHVNLTNIEIEHLYETIKKYLRDLKLDIIHEDKFSNYWSVKAYKGGKLNTIIGSVRDVEVMITGTENNYDLVLRTGATNTPLKEEQQEEEKQIADSKLAKI